MAMAGAALACVCGAACCAVGGVGGDEATGFVSCAEAAKTNAMTATDKAIHRPITRTCPRDTFAFAAKLSIHTKNYRDAIRI